MSNMQIPTAVARATFAFALDVPTQLRDRLWVAFGRDMARWVEASDG